MNTAKIYKDSEGVERTIHQMVKYEPGWAANRIQAGEDALNSLQQLKAKIAAIIPDIVTSFALGDEKQFIALTNELRQLSAV